MICSLREAFDKAQTVGVWMLLIRDRVQDLNSNAASDFYWKEARKWAELQHVRFKDLRSQFAIYGQKAGVPGIVTSKAMGHASQAMAARYQQYAAIMTADQAAAIGRSMFGKNGLK